MCDIKKQQIEDYFGHIGEQVVTLSEDPTTIEALRGFTQAFDGFRDEAKWGNDEFAGRRDDLRDYYINVFEGEYAKQNPGASANAGAKVSMLSEEAIALQSAFIEQNRNPLGSKQLLDATKHGTSYDRVHQHLHPVFRSYLDRFGYYDIFLADTEGRIVYSVFKELDFATNLNSGPFANSNIARCYKAAISNNAADSMSFVDFESYWPSYEAPASFIASPVFDGQEKIGVLIFQMPVDRINELLGSRVGLGETGETLLVGSDFLPRSNSFADPVHRNIVSAFRNPDSGRVESESVNRGLAGDATVEEAKNYLGTPVLSASSPVDVHGVRWALIANIETSEAFKPTESVLMATSQANGSMINASLLLALLTTVGVGAFAWYSVRSLMQPIDATVATLKDIASGDGDLTARLDDSRSDELGDLSRWFNTFAGRIHDLVATIADNATTLTGSSAELNSTASHLAQGASQSKSQSATVSAAAEEMSINMRNMAESSDGMSQTIRSVSASIEEMNETIREIARNAERSASVAGEATEIVSVSNGKITALGTAANEIGRVIEVIQDIAEQTNLLALNATIEAARAGEAGKGFAVVATEVKELAKQTASATDDIRARIEAIQVSTGEAVDSIQAISEVINNVSEVSRTIASAVEEQSITTRQIADNISTTAQAAESVARGVQETASASQEITQNISRVDGVLEETVTGADQSRMAGERLSQLAAQMNNLVAKFRISRQEKAGDSSLSA